MTTSSTPSNGLTLTDALAWIAEMFEEPRGTISPATARTDIPAWDSLGQLILMSALDQRFGIRLTRDELTGLGSVQDILDVLARRQLLVD